MIYSNRSRNHEKSPPAPNPVKRFKLRRWQGQKQKEEDGRKKKKKKNGLSPNQTPAVGTKEGKRGKTKGKGNSKGRENEREKRVSLIPSVGFSTQEPPSSTSHSPVSSDLPLPDSLSASSSIHLPHHHPGRL